MKPHSGPARRDLVPRRTLPEAPDPVGRLLVQALRVGEGEAIDLELAPAECVALGGPSGSGKTRLLRAIADLDPHAGRLLLDDRECAGMEAPAWRRRVGLLPPESRWWRPSVGEHLCGVSATDLARLGFGADVLGWSVERLSSGERQRLALLRLLANRPEVLLLDEPTANLDAENAVRAEALLADYRKTQQAAVLWVTHDRAQARRVASRCLRMEAGRLLTEDPA